MGKRGPAPKPTALRVLHGDRKDRINVNEPNARDALPEAPALSDEAQRVWDFTLGEIAHMGIARSPDRDSLAAYCEAVAVHRRASAMLSHTKLLIEGQKGNLVRNPMVQMQRDAAMVIKAFAAEFGLTPRARSEIRVMGDVAKPNSKADLLSS